MTSFQFSQAFAMGLALDIWDSNTGIDFQDTSLLAILM